MMRRIAGAMMVAAGLAGTAGAQEFTLVHADKATGVYTLRFANGELGNPFETDVPNPPFPQPDVDPAAPSPEVLGLAIPPDAAPPMPCETSALIALSPGEPVDGWTVSGKHATVRPVRLGRVAALQVIVDRCALGKGATATIEVVPPPPGKSPGALGADPATFRADWLRPAFLNGAAWVPASAPRATKGAAVAAPSDPGDWRATYGVTPGGGTDLPGEILTLDPADIGTNVSLASQVRLVYNQIPIPIGGEVGGDLWFYAPRTHGTHNDSDSVFLTPEAAAPSPPMATRPAFETLAPAGVEVPQGITRVYETNGAYERDSLNPAGERIVFYRHQAGGTPATRSTSFDFPDVLTDLEVTVEVEVHGLNQSLTVDPDHYIDVTVSGAALARRSWNDRTILRFRETVTLPAAPPGQLFSFAHTIPGDTVDTPLDGGVDIQNLEEVAITYTALPRLDTRDTARLELPLAGAPRLVTVGGFPAATPTADIAVLDITDELAPVRLIGLSTFPDGVGNTAVEFEARPTTSTFVIQDLGRLRSVDQVVPAETLPAPLGAGTTLTGIHVRPAVYTANLAPLTALRGPGVLTVDPQAAYNAYSGGRKDPEALRQSLAYLIENSAETVAMPSVLLAGHASFDPRNYLGAHASAKIPTSIFIGNVSYNGSFREYPSDFPYTHLFGEDELPDVALGRLPARSAADLDNAVARYLAHAPLVDSLTALDRQAFFLTDNTPPLGSPLFAGDVPLWEYYWQSTGRPTYHYDATDAVAARPVVESQFEAAGGGTAFVLFIGHGNFREWMDNEALNTSMVRNDIETDGQWPFVSSLTCQNGLYSHPVQETANESLGQAWVFAVPTRGAVGVATSTTEQTYGSLRPVVEEMMRGMGWSSRVEEQAFTAGNLQTLGKISYLSRFANATEAIQGESLFGDPDASLTLDYPLAGTSVGDWLGLEGDR